MSIDDEVLETQEVETTTEAPAESPSEPVEAGYGDPRDQLAEEIDKIERQGRDEMGRFAAKQPAEAPAETVEKPTLKDLGQLGFNKAEIEVLAELPEAVRLALEARDNRYHEGLKPLKEMADIARQFTDALSPHREYLEALQVSPSDFIPALIEGEKILRLGTPEQKIQAFQAWAHDYGVDLSLLAQQPFDPRLYALQQERDSLNRRLQQQERAQQSAEQQQTDDYVREWAQGKEHFEEVRTDMAMLLKSGKAQGLDDAYDKALRLSDTYFAQQQMLQADKAAKLAKQSAVQVKGSPVGRAPSMEFKNRNDDIRYHMGELGMH